VIFILILFIKIKNNILSIFFRNVSTTPTECKACDSDKISKCNFPYASKLLMQELQAMGIKMAIKVKK